MADQVRRPRPDLAGLVPYDVKEVRADIILASNENPHNLPAELQLRLSERMRLFEFNRYPEPTAPRLRRLIGEGNGLDPEWVLAGDGGDELILNVFLAWGGPGRKCLNFPPTFSMYDVDAQITGTEMVNIPRDEHFNIDHDAALERLKQGDIDIVIVANPNNPTGNLASEAFLLELISSTDALVLIDEAYFEFSRTTVRPYLERHPNLLILRTFSKAFSFAAMRVGYVLGSPEVLTELKRVRQPYSLNAFSQWAAQVVYRERMVFENAIYEITTERDRVMAGLEELDGIEVFPSEANYIMFRVPSAADVWHDLLYGHSIYIRDLSRTPLLEGCLRVTIGTREQNDAFLTAMRHIMSQYRIDGKVDSNG